MLIFPHHLCNSFLCIASYAIVAWDKDDIESWDITVIQGWFKLQKKEKYS